MWRSSPYTGNGMARIDGVEMQTCIDCHMERTPATADELGAKHGTIASHRFVGGHTWMASMRDDHEQLRLTRAKLEGAASIDVAGARVTARGTTGGWHLPADAAPVIAGTQIELDVVLRNVRVGHRFPGGLLDVQDTWVEIEVADRRGKRLASSGVPTPRIQRTRTPTCSTRSWSMTTAARSTSTRSRRSARRS
ncbi:MAG: Tetratricopeptide 4 [Myxococcales bacterium]|nr:Tetratricopeptide 4 [Myxococcales bacterium]